MKNTGTLRIQTFAARQSAPMEGVTVAVQGDGFTLHCITDATGSAADIPVEAPACTLSLDEDNTIRPYAVVSLTAAKSGYRTVRIEGIQIFAGQITLAQPAMIPVTEEGKDTPDAPIVIPPHPLFAGSGGSGAQPVENCTPRVLDKVIIPKNITVHLGKPAASARNVTVSFRDYIANVASSEVYPTWADENSPTGQLNCLPTQKFHSIVIFCPPVRASFGPTTTRSTSSTASSRVRCETCANSLTRCIWVWIVALSSFCCSSSDSSFSILASALLTSLRKDLFISKNCAESIRPDTLSRYSSCIAFRRRSTSPRSLRSSSRIA